MFSQNFSRTSNRCVYPPFPRSVWIHPNAPVDDYDLVCKYIWLKAKKTKDELDLWHRLNLKNVQVPSSDSPPIQRYGDKQRKPDSARSDAEKQRSTQEQTKQELQQQKELQEKLEKEPLSKESRLHLYRSNFRQPHRATPAAPQRPEMEPQTRPKEQGADNQEQRNRAYQKQPPEPLQIVTVDVEKNKTDKVEHLTAYFGSTAEGAAPHSPPLEDFFQEDLSPDPLKVPRLGRWECESEDEPEASSSSSESSGSSGSAPLPTIRSAGTDSSEDDSDVAFPRPNAENAKGKNTPEKRIQGPWRIEAKQDPPHQPTDFPSLQRPCNANAGQNVGEKKGENTSSSSTGMQQLKQNQQQKKDQQQQQQTPEQEPLLKESRLLRFYRLDLRQPHTATSAPPLGPKKETEAEATERETHKDPGNMVDLVPVDKHQNKIDKAEPPTANSGSAPGCVVPNSPFQEYISPAPSKVPRLGTLRCENEDESEVRTANGKSSGSSEPVPLSTASDSSDDVVLSDMEEDIPAQKQHAFEHAMEISPKKTVQGPWKIPLLDWNHPKPNQQVESPSLQQPHNFTVTANGPHLNDREEDILAQRKNSFPRRVSSSEFPRLCNTLDANRKATMENVPKKKIKGPWEIPHLESKQDQADYPSLRRPCDGKGPHQENGTKIDKNRPRGASSICAGNQKSAVDPQTCIQTISCEPLAATHQLAPGGTDGVGVAARTWASTAKAGHNQSAAASQERVKPAVTINRICRQYDASNRGGLNQGNTRNRGQLVQTLQVRSVQDCKIKGNPTRR